MHVQEGPNYWPAWSQQDVNSEYRNATADGHGLLPYHRQMASYGPVPSQVAATNYITANSYDAALPLATSYAPGPSYNAPTSTVRSGLYEPAVTAHNPYASRQYHHRQPLPMIATSPIGVDQNPACSQGAGESSVHHVERPLVSIKPDPHLSSASGTEDISPTPAIDVPQADNPVNNILWVIQSKSGVSSLANRLDGLSVTDEEDLKDQPTGQHASPASKKARRRQPKPGPLRRHCCEFPGCDKRFAQKAQLTAHVRVHTGEKPYHCRYGCGISFAQPGNRTTHHRSHTGEAPYQCQICGKRFRSGGNLGPHLKTHTGVKEYVCRLDNCGKAISTKGNLKTHQTKYHSATLEALSRRLSEIKDIKSASEEDRKMFEYMGSVHNNLNKGIKGCRGHRIRPRPLTSSRESSAPLSPASYNDNPYVSFPGNLQPYQQDPPVHLNATSPYSDAYNLGHQNVTAQAEIHIDARMYDSDVDSMASPSSTATYDDEEEQRIVARQCRF